MRSTARLGMPIKLKLAALTLLEYGHVVSGLRSSSLPEVVRRLESTPHRVVLPPLDPRLMGKLVVRVLDRKPLRPRCLTLSLVLFRMLVRQNTRAHLVIGLPPSPSSHEAHAWVEVAGVEVGPPPGRHAARAGGRPTSRPRSSWTAPRPGRCRGPRPQPKPHYCARASGCPGAENRRSRDGECTEGGRRRVLRRVLRSGRRRFRVRVLRLHPLA